MDSKVRFVLVYSSFAMAAFGILAFLNTNDIGIYVSSFAILYFALRLILNPKIRTQVDWLGLVLLALFVYYVGQRVLTILGH
jgi:hypothetical protein